LPNRVDKERRGRCLFRFFKEKFKISIENSSWVTL
jgi:hypothetical protein